jgi:hypothetical protein
MILEGNKNYKKIGKIIKLRPMMESSDGRKFMFS